MDESYKNSNEEGVDLLRDNAVYLKHINSWAIDCSDSMILGLRLTPSIRELSQSKYSNNVYSYSADEILYRFNNAVINDSNWKDREDSFGLKQAQLSLTQYLYQLFSSINQTKAKESIIWRWTDSEELNSIVLKERGIWRDIIVALLDKIDRINSERQKTADLLKAANDQIHDFKARYQLLK